ncbi:MAG: hypothetical protein ACLPKB_14795 [Xanthobacteraceae bacterium]
MRIIKLSIAAGLASACVIGSAAAADMTGAEIQSFMSGKTGYVETSAASVTGAVGKGAIYWAADGSGLYKTPQGPVWHGTWSIKGDLYCSEWKEAAKRPCMKLEKQGDVVSFIDVESGQLRIKVMKTAPGNAESLN